MMTTKKKTTRNDFDYVIFFKVKTSFQEKQPCDNEPQEKNLYTIEISRN